MRTRPYRTDISAESATTISIVERINGGYVADANGGGESEVMQ